MSSEKFDQLDKEIKPYLKMLEEAHETIRDQGVSDFPIFVFHQQTVELGIPLAERTKVQGNWSVNATTLEEMTQKSVIKPEKVEHFKKQYKDAEHTYCLFVLSEMGAQFVFIPRK